MINQRYTGKLREEALKFHRETGGVIGLEKAGTLDGGYRGQISIVPELPEGRYQKHLDWVVGGLAAIDGFFQWLGEPKSYRWKPLGLRFYRSIGKRTPAAYAQDWQVSYNVEGGINSSADAVRETLFHEIFHLNDEEHRNWSKRALEAIFRRIVARCGARTPCLTPYAPGTTMVRGGTYYAFQPGNGVGEYAAELALRYYVEHHQVQRGEPITRPFKCGPEENRLAWGLLVDEFFGVDRIPGCLR
ncbi:MAG: hypothetical protein NZX77_21525 [Polyangiaceae bacterium]|nr:hypothetical protein [Polyangiaceae bacterium]